METSSLFLKDPSAVTLVAGDLEAVFLPGYGMLGASLRHRHVEILRRVQDLEVAAAKGSTAGIPLLHPWANRLAGPRYRTAGREVVLDPSSPLLHFDEHGLPMHGVPWSLLAWELTEARQDRLAARLEWSRRDLLAVFPFHHRLDRHPRPRPLDAGNDACRQPRRPGPGELRLSPLFRAAGPSTRGLAAASARNAAARARPERDPNR